MKRVLCVLWVGVFLSATPSRGESDQHEGTETEPSAQPDPCPQKKQSFTSPVSFKGVWVSTVDSDFLDSAANVKKGCDQLRSWNMDSIFPNVWRGHELMFRRGTTSSVVPKLRGDFDQLLAVVREAHAPGKPRLKVYAWPEYGLQIPIKSPLVKLHPQWFARRKSGEVMWSEGPGQDFAYLNPAHPGARKFIRDMVRDLVTRYEVDGINIDDNFGLPPALGYDPQTLKMFRDERYRASKRFPPLEPPAEDDPEWVKWRTEKINSLVRELAAIVHSSAKVRGAKVIVASNPLRYTKKDYMQDWGAWIKEGFVDAFILENYKAAESAQDLEKSVAHFKNELVVPDLIEAMRCVPVGIGIFTGMRTKRSSSESIEAQIKTLNLGKPGGFDGVAFFHYGFMDKGPPGEDPSARSAMWKRNFPAPSRR